MIVLWTAYIYIYIIYYNVFSCVSLVIISKPCAVGITSPILQKRKPKARLPWRPVAVVNTEL